MAHVLGIGRDVDAIVFTGLYHKAENAEYMRTLGIELGIELPFDDAAYHRRKTMPGDLDDAVISAWRSSGISTPLFRKTSCGVSFAHQLPEYNGHWGVREICDICPTAQKKLCADDHRQPTDSDMRGVLDQFGYASPWLIEDGHVWTHGLGEQKRYALQRTLRYQIWEIDQPHFLHAHGRSLTGHQPPADQTEHFAVIRASFTQATRYEDE